MQRPQIRELAQAEHSVVTVLLRNPMKGFQLRRSIIRLSFTVGIAQALPYNAAPQPHGAQPDDIKAVIARFDTHQRKKPPTVSS